MRRSKLARRPNGDVKTKYFTLKGGLNLVDAPISIPPGMVLAAVNYELLSRDGYRRVDGFERFDGKPSPSDASYWILDYDTGSDIEIVEEAPAVGSQAIGVTSGAKGEVGVVVIDTGAWADDDAAGYFVIFALSGTFLDNEPITFLGEDDGYGSGFSAGFG